MQEYFAILIEEKLSIYLIMLKIFPNLKGYDFLKEGAKRIIFDKAKKVNVGIGLYNEIAQDYSIRQGAVDRSMRHCLDVSFKRKGILDFERAYCIKFSSIRPRPKELICILAQREYDEVQKERVATIKKKKWSVNADFEIEDTMDEMMIDGKIFGLTSKIMKNGKESAIITRNFTLMNDSFTLEADEKDIPLYTALVIAFDNMKDKMKKEDN